MKVTQPWRPREPPLLSDTPMVTGLGKISAGTYTQGSHFQTQVTPRGIHKARYLLSSPFVQNTLCEMRGAGGMQKSVTSFLWLKNFPDILIPSSVLGLEQGEGGDGDLSPAGTGLVGPGGELKWFGIWTSLFWTKS